MAFGTLGAGVALGVTGGQPDSGHPYVGMAIQTQVQNGVQGFEVCSGFLVSPTKFVTAAHCFDPADGPVYVSFEQTPPKPAIGSIPAPPDWIPATVINDPAYCTNCGKAGGPTNDVAVITVPAQNLSTYAQLPPLGYDATLPKGQLVDVVGYGLQSSTNKKGAGPFGEREVAVTKSNGVDANYLKLLGDPGACEGDSGGPDLQVGTNIALALNTFSNGNPNCNGVTYSIRLDQPDVQAFILATP